MKIKQIGSVVLDHSLWWLESENSSKVQSLIKKNLDGGVIVFEQPKRSSSVIITAQSRDDGWQKEDTLDALVLMANTSLGSVFNITDSDDNVISCRFRHEIQDGAVQFERIADAKEIGWFKGVIYMAKV